MKITINKCPWTGKLFESDEAYASHLKSLRHAMRSSREKARLALVFDEFVKPLYGLDTSDKIVDWLNENYMKVALHFGFRFADRKKPYVPTKDDYVVFEFSNLKFSPDCPTTHCVPRGQRTTGWSSDSPHIPEPGWRGRITIRLYGNAYHKDLFDTDHLKKIGINTGGGGGCSEKLAYELTLFTKDFAGLRKRAILDKILRDHNRPGMDANGERLVKGDAAFG